VADSALKADIGPFKSKAYGSLKAPDPVLKLAGYPFQIAFGAQNSVRTDFP
jgi:hypothetical protein